MLFHVTATHTPDDCPIYNADVRDAARQAAEQTSSLAKEQGITVHAAVTGAPEHVVYFLLEADSFEPVATFLAHNSAFPQDFTITPVMPLPDVAQTVLRD
jgi:uncharacterized protein DUF3303